MNATPLSKRTIVEHRLNGGQQSDLYPVYGEQTVKDMVEHCYNCGLIEATWIETHNPGEKPYWLAGFVTEKGRAYVGR